NSHSVDDRCRTSAIASADEGALGILSIEIPRISLESEVYAGERWKLLLAKDIIWSATAARAWQITRFPATVEFSVPICRERFRQSVEATLTRPFWAGTVREVC
ncbi:MAG: hypothetical protein WBW33_04115, partial [Bryobacteraceae bacterium]